MCYNIRNAFHDTKEPNELQKERLTSAQKVIKKENPDILIIVEAYFKQNNNIKTINYKKYFNFPYCFISENDVNHKFGFAFLSKYPIKNKENLCNRLISLLRTRFDIKGESINIDAVHVSPHISELKKRGFFERILKRIRKPYILAGDFNSLSPQDKYNKRKMVKSFNKFSRNPKKIVEDLLKKETIRYILSNGLRDTFRKKQKKFDYTIPTNFLSEDKDSAMRIDYIFCSSDFKVFDAYIVKNSETEKASDHYPVVAILRSKSLKK